MNSFISELLHHLEELLTVILEQVVGNRQDSTFEATEESQLRACVHCREAKHTFDSQRFPESEEVSSLSSDFRLGDLLHFFNDWHLGFLVVILMPEQERGQWEIVTA